MLATYLKTVLWKPTVYHNKPTGSRPKHQKTSKTLKASKVQKPENSTSKPRNHQQTYKNQNYSPPKTIFNLVYNLSTLFFSPYKQTYIPLYGLYVLPSFSKKTATRSGHRVTAKRARRARRAKSPRSSTSSTAGDSKP